jgi:hypothetical protein
MARIRDNSVLGFTAVVVIGAGIVIVGLVILSAISVAVHETLAWLYSSHTLAFAAGYVVCLFWHDHIVVWQDRIRRALSR